MFGTRKNPVSHLHGALNQAQPLFHPRQDILINVRKAQRSMALSGLLSVVDARCL